MMFYGQNGPGGLSVGGKYVTVVDNVEKEYAGLNAETPVFSPDSQRVAWVTDQWGAALRKIVVVDNVTGKRYAAVVAERMTFSPDSQHLPMSPRTPLGLKSSRL